MGQKKISKKYLHLLLFVTLIGGVFIATLAVQENQDRRSRAQTAPLAAPLTDDYSDQTKIAQNGRTIINTSTKQVTLQENSNTLPDSSTLLFTRLGSEADIQTPAIGAGGTATNVTYTTGGGGSTGEAAIISGNGNTISFPATGNYKKGSIDFWLSLANWSLDSNNRSPSYPYDQTIFHTVDGDKQIWLLRTWNGNIRLYFQGPGGGVYSPIIPAKDYAPDSWHRFTFSWNIEDDVFYIAVWIDGAYKQELAVSSPQTFDIQTVFSSFNPKTIYIGTKNNGTYPLKGKIDELRITSSEYSTSNFPIKPGILTSTAFDTGVPSPVWGNIKWNETLPAKTDIELQSSTSDDGINWTNWFVNDKGMVTATFDDGYAGVYRDAFPIMKSLNYKGLPYVVPNDLGKPGFMTLAQVKELQDAGWEIGSHTMSHMACPSSEQLATSRQWLIDNGLGHDALAYPGGCFNKDVISRVSEHYTTARTIIYHYQTFNTKYQVYGFSANSGVANTNNWLNKVETKKAWGVINFHGIGDTGTPANITPQDFSAIMQHISTKNLDVVTMKEALERLGMYTNNSGEQIRSANKRYIRYRAILHTYDGNNTPTLSGVSIAAPTKIYKDLPTTISSDGTFSHATWPQTTNTPIETLTMTPNAGSVTATVETWNTANDYYKKWKEKANTGNVTVTHTIGDLQANNSYQVKKNGSTWNIFQANTAGQISFADTASTDTETTFEIEKAPDATATSIPTLTPEPSPTQTPSSSTPTPLINQGSIAGLWKAEGNANEVVYGNNGTLQNGAAFAAGKIRQGFAFQSTNEAQVVTVPYSPNFDLNSEVTMEAWINPSTIDPTTFINKNPYGTIVAKSILPNRNYGMYLYRGGAIHLSFVDEKGNVYLDTPANVITPSTWQQVTATIKWGPGGSMKIYVDGILKASKEISTYPRTSTNVPLTIGNESARIPFPGLIDEVYIYRRALSPSEI